MTAHQPIRGPERGHAAIRRRRNDRAGSLRADGERHQPRCHRRRRAAGGSSRPARPVPWIQARAEKRSRREAVSAAARQFHHGEFARQHGAPPASLSMHRGVVIEHLAGVRFRAPGGGLPGIRQQVFHTVRNALQRPAQTPALNLLVHLPRPASVPPAPAAAPARYIADPVSPAAPRKPAPVPRRKSPWRSACAFSSGIVAKKISLPIAAIAPQALNWNAGSVSMGTCSLVSASLFALRRASAALTSSAGEAGAV